MRCECRCVCVPVCVSSARPAYSGSPGSVRRAWNISPEEAEKRRPGKDSRKNPRGQEKEGEPLQKLIKKGFPHPIRPTSSSSAFRIPLAGVTQRASAASSPTVILGRLHKPARTHHPAFFLSEKTCFLNDKRHYRIKKVVLVLLLSFFSSSRYRSDSVPKCVHTQLAAASESDQAHTHTHRPHHGLASC